MSRQRCVPFRLLPYAALINVASLLMGCSDLTEPVHSKTEPDSQLVTTELQVALAEAPVADPQPLIPEVTTSEIVEPPVEPVISKPAADAPVADIPAIAKPEREPIYAEEANGKDLIAAAMKKAQRDHKHVLIEWGGNWCGWCYKLHDVFHNDTIVQPIVHEEFVLVLIDSGKNKELMLEYGGKDRQYSYPHLTVLDEQGVVLTNQETDSLEEGPKHDPKLVAEFLGKWTPG